MDTPGVESLRTPLLDGDAEHVWRAYAGLTGA